MSETDKILGIDQLRSLQLQLADLKAKHEAQLKEATRRREADHVYVRMSIKSLSEALAGHGTGDLEWEMDQLKKSIKSEIDDLKFYVLGEETP